MPPDGLNIRIPDNALAQERRLHGPKMAAVAAFARANPIDEIVTGGTESRRAHVERGSAACELEIFRRHQRSPSNRSDSRLRPPFTRLNAR